MQSYTIPEPVRQRVLRRQGRLFSHDTIDPKRAALVVVDMQNYFVATGHPGEVPAARGIVGNVNRMASAMRSAGGAVIWVQTTATGALEHWANHHRHMLTPERAAKRLAALADGSASCQLYPELEARPGDIYVKKIKYSALVRDSSDLEEVLRRRRAESVIIAGTTTNVCCESTARDAMLLDFRVIVLSDATAASSVEEHAASLTNIQLYFGDVMTVDEALERLSS